MRRPVDNAGDNNSSSPVMQRGGTRLDYDCQALLDLTLMNSTR